MDPAVLALVFSSAVFCVQLVETGFGVVNWRVGLDNRRRVGVLEGQIAASVERADDGREKILAKFKEIKTPELKPEPDPRIDAMLQSQQEIATALNQIIELLQRAPSSPATEFNGIDPTEARMTRTMKEDERDLANAEILGAIGPVAYELWQQFAPDVFRQALKKPHLWRELWARIKPQLENRQKDLVSLNAGTAAAPRRGNAPYI